MESSNQIKQLDGITSLEVINQKSAFPEHYHDTFCISLIKEGVEAIKMGNNVLYSEKGHISINNPYEIHSNPIIDGNLKNSFTTIYLSPDLVDFFLHENKVHFCHQQSVDLGQIGLFQTIVENLKHKSTDINQLEATLSQLLGGLETQEKPVLESLKYPNHKWLELMLFIDNHLEEKITLDFLSKFMNMDKFNFAKEFRSKYGLSPINYVLMKKIFHSKELISSDTNLSQLAYQFNFSDQAHFSKQFKRFVGVSPREYKNQL